MHTFLTLLVPVLFVSVSEDAAQKDQAALQGAWRLVKMESSEGKQKPSAEELEKFRLTMKGNKITFRSLGGEQEETFTLDPTKNPKAIDITMSRGEQAAKKVPGIYKIEGDLLTVCFALMVRDDDPSQNRPTEFSVQGHNNRFLMVLERDKEGK